MRLPVPLEPPGRSLVLPYVEGQGAAFINDVACCGAEMRSHMSDLVRIVAQ